MSDTYLIPQFIIDYLQKSRSTKIPQILIGKRLKKFKTPEIETWFKENKVTASYIWRFFVSQGKTEFEYKFCEVCGKQISLKRILANPNRKYCSCKCRANSKEIREKYKQTLLKKYGVENPFQSKEVREKIKLQSKEIQEKIKQTNLEKYGTEYPLQSKEIRERGKQTCLKKYGVTCSLQLKEIQEKIKETNLEKYGVENPLQSKEIKEKRKQTCLEKYGVKHYSQSKESKHILRSNHWETFCSKLKERNVVPLFSKEDYINDIGRKFKCLMCGKEFESEGTNNYCREHRNKDGSYKTLQTRNIYCPHCYYAHFSKKEKDVVEFVKSIYNGTIEENVKGLFQHGNMELDIYLPYFNIGIEFDGNYWHSTYEAKERDAIKNTLCEQKGIRLLRIKESDWDNNPEKVKEEIKSFLNLK